jgi:hypothetical protein
LFVQNCLFGVTKI